MSECVDYFKEIAKSKGYKESYERALLAMTANRLCDPESKLGVWERWLSKVFLPSCNDLKLADMYEAMDLFHKHCAEIEQRIFFATADLFNLDVDVVFYDTTTASFTLDEADAGEDLRRILPIALHGFLGLLDQTATLVVADGLHVDSGRLGELADGHPHGVVSVGLPWCWALRS